MTNPSETVILCEGYHDRAFWSGMLESAGYVDARPVRSKGTFGKAIDPFNKPVEGGEFAFRSSTGEFIRVKPCGGASKIPDRMKTRLAQRTTEPLKHLIINLDTDAADGEDDATTRSQLLLAHRDRIHGLVPDVVEDEPGDLLVDGNSTRISVVLWSAPEPPTVELPDKQTLERVLCAALRDAYPERTRKVAEWLLSRPDPPHADSKSYKAHTWLHMGGWYPAFGCEHFYNQLWQVEIVQQKLRQRVAMLLPTSVRRRFINAYANAS